MQTFRLEFPSIENAYCENVSLGVGKCSSMNFRTTMHFKLLWLMFGNLATTNKPSSSIVYVELRPWIQKAFNTG